MPKGSRTILNLQNQVYVGIGIEWTGTLLEWFCHCMEWLLINQARLSPGPSLKSPGPSLSAQQPIPTRLRLQIYVSADFLPPAGVTTLRELNGQLTKIVARGRGLFQYTNSALSARRRLTCPCNECGRDKNLTDGQNIFDVFTFSKYFASFLLLITIQSQNYLSFFPQQSAFQQQEKYIFITPECIYQNVQKGDQTDSVSDCKSHLSLYTVQKPK